MDTSKDYKVYLFGREVDLAAPLVLNDEDLSAADKFMEQTEAMHKQFSLVDDIMHRLHDDVVKKVLRSILNREPLLEDRLDVSFQFESMQIGTLMYYKSVFCGAIKVLSNPDPFTYTHKSTCTFTPFNELPKPYCDYI